MTNSRRVSVSPPLAELLQWSVTFSAQEVVVALTGDVDLSTAEELSEVLAHAVERRVARVVVDVAKVSFLDSTGIHCLVDAARKSSEIGCKLVVVNPTVAIERVFTICGVDRLLLGETEQRNRSGSLAS